MGAEHAIVCGEAKDSKLPFGGDNVVRLELDGAQANVDLRFDDLQVALWKAVPPVLNDLVRLAAYVYAADQATARPDDDEGFTAGWQRRLFFRVPVRDPDRWNSPGVRNVLTETLAFLSGDEFAFEFVPDRRVRQLPLGFEKTPFEGEIDEVSLFSGGLDSLAGAVRASRVEHRKALMVTHRSTQKVVRWQAALIEALKRHAGNAAPVFAHVRVNKNEGLKAERTQRSRSFLFASLAGAFAGTIGLDRIRFYENGVVSLNLPLSAQVVGSRATRTTHPRVLTGLSQLFTELVGRSFEVENPFLWHTKADVVRVVSDTGCGDLIGLSRSCARTATQSNEQPHCGVCSQCIDRRFAVLAAGQAASDPVERYAVELFTGERSDGRPRGMLAGYLETAREVAGSDPVQFYGRFGMATRVFNQVGEPVGQAAKRVFELYRRHARDVRGVLERGLAEHAARVVDRALPSSCLIRIVIDVQNRPETEEPVSPPRTPSPSETSCFRLRGHFWEVRFNNGPVNHIERSRGASYFHTLLSQAGRSLTAAQLAATVSRTRHGLPDGDAGTTSDKESLSAYHARLEELNSDIAAAERDGLSVELDSFRQEKEFLLNELSRCLDIQGKLRRVANHRERVRRAVFNALDRLARSFVELDPPLAEHLHDRQFLRRGHSPCYVSPSGITWVT